MQEKSVILQCLRYIADNNFFGKGGEAVVDGPVAEESNSVPKTLDEEQVSTTDANGMLADAEPVEQPAEAVIAEEENTKASVDQEQPIIECCDSTLGQ